MATRCVPLDAAAADRGLSLPQPAATKTQVAKAASARFMPNPSLSWNEPTSEISEVGPLGGGSALSGHAVHHGVVEGTTCQGSSRCSRGRERFAGGVVGAVLDEPESDCVVDVELEELSVWAQATDAPPPTIVAASASPASACFMRSVMSFTSLRCCWAFVAVGGQHEQRVCDAAVPPRTVPCGCVPLLTKGSQVVLSALSALVARLGPCLVARSKSPAMSRSRWCSSPVADWPTGQSPVRAAPQNPTPAWSRCSADRSARPCRLPATSSQRAPSTSTSKRAARSPRSTSRAVSRSPPVRSWPSSMRPKRKPPSTLRS